MAKNNESVVHCKHFVCSTRTLLTIVFVVCFLILAKNQAPLTGVHNVLRENVKGALRGSAVKKKVYMFIGPHKTGSSTLRYFLTSNIDRDEAQKQGLYLDPNFKELKHYEKYAWIANRHAAPVTEEDIEAYNVFLNYMQDESGHEKKLVASEIIDYWDEDTWRKELSLVSDHEVFVIFFLRERYAHAYSLYNQRNKKYTCPQAFATEYKEFTSKLLYFTGEMYNILQNLFDSEHTYVISLEGTKEAGKSIPEVVVCEIIGVCDVGEHSKELRNVGVPWEILAARWVLCIWSKYRGMAPPPVNAADLPSAGQTAIDNVSQELCKLFSCVCKSAREHLEELESESSLANYSRAVAPFQELARYPPKIDIGAVIHCRLELYNDEEMIRQLETLSENHTRFLDNMSQLLSSGYIK